MRSFVCFDVKSKTASSLDTSIWVSSLDTSTWVYSHLLQITCKQSITIFAQKSKLLTRRKRFLYLGATLPRNYHETSVCGTQRTGELTDSEITQAGRNRRISHSIRARIGNQWRDLSRGFAWSCMPTPAKHKTSSTVFYSYEYALYVPFLYYAYFEQSFLRF